LRNLLLPQLNINKHKGNKKPYVIEYDIHVEDIKLPRYVLLEIKRMEQTNISIPSGNVRTLYSWTFNNSDKPCVNTKKQMTTLKNKLINQIIAMTTSI
jgi:Holliday junction resolvase